MTLAEEYQQQNKWRNWHTYLSNLPIQKTDVVLDLGCGTGEVTRLIANKCRHVVGVDNNAELVKFAKQNNSLANANFVNINLINIDILKIPIVDGIWCSFTAAYFPNLMPILSKWVEQLKPGGWLAMVEVDDLFGHQPLTAYDENIFKAHCNKLFIENIYDFQMGRKLCDYLAAVGLNTFFGKDIADIELSFNGRADQQVIIAWQNRLNRLRGLQSTLGKIEFLRVKEAFINCLNNDKHSCSAKVKYVIARKNEG